MNKQITFLISIIFIFGVFTSCDNSISLMSSNADLSNLTVSTGTLNPVFSASTTDYTISVPYETSNITITGTAADSNSTLSTTSGIAQELNVGTTKITITVTAQDKTTTRDYVITVTRAEDLSKKIEYLNDRALWNYPEENLYRLAFSFQNATYERISGNATIDILIINTAEETVYSKKENINLSNFALWYFQDGSSKYLCTISIPYSEINKGLSSTGNILFTILLEDNRKFDQSKLSINALPTRSALLGEIIPFSGNISVNVEKIFYNRTVDGDKYLYLGNNIPVAKITLTNNSSTSLYVSPSYFSILDQTSQIDYEYYTFSNGRYDETGVSYVDNESKSMLSGTVHTIYITFNATNQLSDNSLFLVSSNSNFPIRVEFTKNEIK